MRWVIALTLLLSGCVTNPLPGMTNIACPPGVNAQGEFSGGGGFGAAISGSIRWHCTGPGAPATP